MSKRKQKAYSSPKKRGKDVVEKPVVEQKAMEKLPFLSLVLPFFNEAERLDAAIRELKSFCAAYQKAGGRLEIIAVDDGSSDGTADLLADAFSKSWAKDAGCRIVLLEKNQGKGTALKNGVAVASGDFVLTLDGDMAASPKQLLKWWESLNHQFDDRTIYLGSREHVHSKINANFVRRAAGLTYNAIVQFLTNLPTADTQCGFKLYPAKIAKSLFSKLKNVGWSHDVELLLSAKLDHVRLKSMPLEWTHVAESKIKLLPDALKMFVASIGIALRLFFSHFISVPLREIKERKWNVNDPSYYRLGFVLLSVFIAILMPILSFDFGITADEPVQKKYGDLVLKYFQSNGKDKGALTYSNLYYYGGLFDYISAWVSQKISAWDAYDTRHFLNAGVGVFMMIFTGLTAKEVSGKWKVGLLALVFIFLSPRVFGHSMNNPKDIPFAAAYVFTLLYLVRFVRQLPFISVKTVLMICLGIAAAINVRVGGILLLAYFFLFVLAGNFLNHDARVLLKNTKQLFRGILTVVSVSVLGYLGGLLYWPFGLEAPFSHPFEALGEMSNFSTSIRLLFEGSHYWSDDLPWYYIPKWFLISSPLFLITGVLFSLILIGYKFNIKERLPLLLVAFAAFFPPVYAIVNDSALYDGIRHFLFVYPSLVILAAWGWEKIPSFVPAKAGKWGVSILLLVLLALPAWWIIRSHPYQYVYFNETVGGIRGAYTYYETDYWMVSSRGVAEWMKNNTSEFKQGEPPRIGSNLRGPENTSAFLYYLNKDLPKDKKVKVNFANFRKRIEVESDYDVYSSRFIDMNLLRSEVWPSETVHVEKVDGVPLTAVSNRGINYGYQAILSEREGKLEEAAALFEKEIAQHPNNDVAIQGAVRCYLNMDDAQKTKEKLNQGVPLSDTSISMLILLGQYQQRSGKLEDAKLTFERIVSLNHKYPDSYLELFALEGSQKNYQEALTHLEKFAIYGGSNQSAYMMGAQIASMAGNKLLHHYFSAKKAVMSADAQGTYRHLEQCLKIDPGYKPAVELKKDMDKTMKKIERERRLNK